MGSAEEAQKSVCLSDSLSRYFAFALGKSLGSGEEGRGRCVGTESGGVAACGLGRCHVSVLAYAIVTACVLWTMLFPRAVTGSVLHFHVFMVCLFGKVNLE